MQRGLEKYRGITSDALLEELGQKVQLLKDSRVVHLNASSYGGGCAVVVEMMVFLMNEVGIKTDWRVIYGNHSFYTTCKKIYNAMQGKALPFTQAELDEYLYFNERFSQFAQLDQDFLIIHDHQPCALINYLNRDKPTIWRDHIDTGNAYPQIWDFFEPMIQKYDYIFINNQDSYHPQIKPHQQIINVSIDPLSDKNRDLSDSEVKKLLATRKIPLDKPYMLQVSRLDRSKDPVGVAQVFKKVREEIDCRLIYCYNSAVDDPEVDEVYQELMKEIKPLVDEGLVIMVDEASDLLVNALQRAATVVIQKSQVEGFGLVITEAMWKEKPVIASKVAGPCRQIMDSVTGYLVEPQDTETFAEKAILLFQNEHLRQSIGQKAKAYIRDNYLVTRHLLDYLNMMLSFS